jgi:hypothetical protein
VVNPVLSTVAQGVKQAGFVGSALFPAVPVGMRAGNIITFGREEFMQYTGLQRAPGGATRRVQVGYAGSPYALVDYSLEGSLPIEHLQEASDGSNGFSIDMAAVTITKTMAIMRTRLEIAQAALATTLGNYPVSNRVTLSGTGQFSDATNQGLTNGPTTPGAIVEAGKEAIRQRTGRRPNTMVIGASVMAVLRTHAQIRNYIQFTGREQATPALLAEFFGIPNVLIGDGVQANDAGVLSDIWGKHIVLAYTELGGIADLGAPSFGYTYQLDGYPVAEDPYYERNSKTWYFPVTTSEAPVIAGNTAGYFIQNAVA